MPARRKCTECDTWLPADAPKIQRTCTAACRARRSRRLKSARKRAGANAPSYEPHQRAVADVVNGDAKDIARKVMTEEMRPVVREAMTDDVLSAVNELIALTPAMVAAIEDDLRGHDKDLRQRAYTLLAKYTLGNPTVAPRPQEQQAAPMQVVFNMPRPGDAPAAEPEIVETKECSECHEHRPLDAFVAGSKRCQDCHEAVQAKVRERFGG